MVFHKIWVVLFKTMSRIGVSWAAVEVSQPLHLWQLRRTLRAFLVLERSCELSRVADKLQGPILLKTLKITPVLEDETKDSSVLCLLHFCCIAGEETKLARRDATKRHKITCYQQAVGNCCSSWLRDSSWFLLRAPETMGPTVWITNLGRLEGRVIFTICCSCMSYPVLSRTSSP